MRRQRFVFLMCVLFALIAVVGLGCKNQFLEKPTFGSSNVANNEQSTGQTTGSVEGFGAPSSLKATQGGYREITLSWNPVQDAVRYYVYRANTQFETFVQVGETGDSSTSYTMKVQSEADFYYRVTAVNHAGEESRFSTIVRGTSLAQPLVSGVEGVEGKEDSDVTVYWYMGNVDAYQTEVRYNVICYDNKGTELARVVVDGSKVKETAAVISGLIPNTSYTYAVEAYIVSAQDKVEKCEPIDAVTARRLRPNAPENLVVQQGQSKDGITLSFNLPALVDVALPGGVYEQKPLYFKIYRREYEEGVEESQKTKKFQLVEDCFGVIKDAEDKIQYAESGEQLVKFGASEESYTPGNTVTWTDTNDLDRGVKYEYKVQSFAYVANRDVTSDMSVATNHGWLIAPATFGTGKYTTVKDNADNPEVAATKNVAASLKFTFDFDTMDVHYHYILEEQYWSLDVYDSNGNVQTPSELKDTQYTGFSSVKAVEDYTREFDLSTPDTVRGYYKYILYILTESQHEVSDATVVLSVLGDTLVTDNINLPVINLFAATSGYNDKITLSWQAKSDYIYTIKYMKEGDETEYTIDHDKLVSGTIQTVGDSDINEMTYEDVDVGEDETRTYVLYVNDGEGGRSASWPIEAKTSSTPKPELANLEYGSITVNWDDVLADSYTISAQYQDTDVAKNNSIEAAQITKHSSAGTGKEQLHTFTYPTGYDNASVSGLPINLTVTANITPVKTVHILEGDEGSSYTVKEEKLDAIILSNTVVARTMGPAAITSTISKGTHEDKIEITWNKVEGAKAYAIIRNRMHITGSKKATFQSTDTYIVEDTSSEDVHSATVQLSGGRSISDPEKVKVTVAAASDDSTSVKFTLTDSLLDSLSATPTGWETSQSQISWGAPYVYFVLPLTDASHEPEYDYSSGAKNVTLAEITLQDANFIEGATSGYGWDVKASKGTYVTSGSKENSAVKVTWTNSWFKDGSYNLYRRQENGSWEQVPNASGTSAGGIIDSSAQPGIVYEYCVRPSGSPSQNDSYIAFASKVMDEVFTTEKASVGFVLPTPTITGASRGKKQDASKNWGVEISWPAVHVGSQVNRMLGGYLVEVYNPNNESPTWEVVKKFDFGTNGLDRDDDTFSQVVADYAKLAVKTQYRLYFRVRAFTENGDVVSKATSWTYSDGYDGSDVKWGARALTHEEFLWCAGEVMRMGIGDAASGWDTQYFGPYNTNGVWSQSSSGVGMWVFVFDNYKRNFMVVQGRLGAESEGSYKLPRFYFNNMTGSVNGTDKAGNFFNGYYSFLREDPGTSTPYQTLIDGDDITVTGTPTDVESGMYNGNIQFIDVGTTSGGHIIVEVNGSTKTLYGGFKKYTPLPGA